MGSCSLGNGRLQQQPTTAKNLKDPRARIHNSAKIMPNTLGKTHGII